MRSESASFLLLTKLHHLKQANTVQVVARDKKKQAMFQQIQTVPLALKSRRGGSYWQRWLRTYRIFENLLKDGIRTQGISTITKKREFDFSKQKLSLWFVRAQPSSVLPTVDTPTWRISKLAPQMICAFKEWKTFLLTSASSWTLRGGRSMWMSVPKMFLRLYLSPKNFACLSIEEPVSHSNSLIIDGAVIASFIDRMRLHIVVVEQSATLWEFCE